MNKTPFSSHDRLSCARSRDHIRVRVITGKFTPWSTCSSWKGPGEALLRRLSPRTVLGPGPAAKSRPAEEMLELRRPRPLSPMAARWRHGRHHRDWPRSHSMIPRLNHCHESARKRDSDSGGRRKGFQVQVFRLAQAFFQVTVARFAPRRLLSGFSVWRLSA
jgi:hypothetical protein